MVVRKDIETRNDIEKMLRSFYNAVLNDDELRLIFINVAHMNLEEHLPVIADFWETILLDNPVYKKKAMHVHYDLNKKVKLLPRHFEKWLLHFNNNIPPRFVAHETAKTSVECATHHGGDTRPHFAMRHICPSLGLGWAILGRSKFGDRKTKQ